MATVEMGGEQIAFPRLCPCCSQPTNDIAEITKTSMEYLVVVIQTRSMRLNVPYCAPCRRHAQWHAGWGMTGVALKALLAWAIVAVLTGIYLDWGNALATILVASGFAALTAWFLARRRPEETLSSVPHARNGWAFEIRSFDKGHLRLALHSEVYAKAFLIANAPGAKRVA